MWSNFFICPCKLFFMLPSNCIPNKVTQFIVNKHIYFLCNIKHIYRGRYLNTVSLPESSQTFFFPLPILTRHIQMFTTNTSKHIVTYNFLNKLQPTFETDLYRVLNDTSCYKLSQLITYFPIYDMILQMSFKTNINDKKKLFKYTVSAIVGKFTVLHINTFG